MDADPSTASSVEAHITFPAVYDTALPATTDADASIPALVEMLAVDATGSDGESADDSPPPAVGATALPTLPPRRYRAVPSAELRLIAAKRRQAAAQRAANALALHERVDQDRESGAGVACDDRDANVAEWLAAQSVSQ